MSVADVPHSIVICEGSAVPAGLDLTPGRKLGPLDVGTAGEWCVKAAGVTTKHAFLFFDGQQLFLQSADPATPVLANGQPLPAEWVAVEAPCEIALGEAVLWFDASRGEDAVASGGGTVPPGTPAEWADDDIDDEDSMPAHLGDQTRIVDPDAIDDEDSEDSIPDHLGDKTNVFPVEEFMARTSATRRAALAQLLNLPLPAAGPEQPSPSGPGAAPPSGPGNLFEEAPTADRLDLPEPAGSQPGLGAPPLSSPLSSPLAVPPAIGSQGGFNEPPPASTSQPGFGPSDPSGQQPPVEMEGLQVLPPSMDPAGETAKTNAAEQQSRWRRMSFPQKATAVLFVPMILSVLVVFDVVPVPNQQRASTRKSAPAVSASAPAGSSTVDAPDAPASAEIPEPQLAQNPAATDSAEPATNGAELDAPDKDPPKDPKGKAKPTKLTKGERTLQRRAVDALASGSYEKAARLYEELAKAHPDNSAYTAAALITRSKAGMKP